MDSSSVTGLGNMLTEKLFTGGFSAIEVKLHSPIVFSIACSVSMGSMVPGYVFTVKSRMYVPVVSCGRATRINAEYDEVPLVRHLVSAPTTLAPCKAAINLQARVPGVFRYPAFMESSI